MQSSRSCFYLLICIVVVLSCCDATSIHAGIDEAGDSLSELITSLVPDKLYDGSYLKDVLDLLSAWRVSPGEIGESLHLNDLAKAFDKGELLRHDFLGPVAKHFAETFESTLDHVTGLYDSEQSAVSEFLESPVESFQDHFGFKKKCTGPGFICGKKIPDACTGPTYSFVIDGGVCIVDDDSGEVVCSRPSVSIAKVPAKCNLKYDESTTVLGHSCVHKKEFGKTVEKIIGKKAQTLELEAGEPYQFLELKDLPLDLSVFFDDLLH